MKYILSHATIWMVCVFLFAGGARANVSCSGTVICPDYDKKTQSCLSSTTTQACPSGTNSCQTTCSNGCAPQEGSQCEAIGGVCGPGLGTCPGTEVCVYQSAIGKYGCTPGSGGGGGGGSSCPAECRQGSACGTGYSSATGCSGAGPGGGCKTNQVCCSANSCGGGGGGGTVQCVQPQDCPPGTVKSATVTSSACDPVCGNNAWGTGGSPGTAQSYTGCCQWETTGGGNCVWEPCPTKNNPGKVCKVCDPEETWCKRETVTTYECIPSCTTQNPSAVTLVSPANGSNVGGTGVTLDWTGVSSWGVACDTARQYEVFVDTVPTPTTIYGVVGEGVTSDYFMGSIGQTYYWKIRAHNGSVYTDSAIRSFTLVANQITGTVYVNNDASCGQGTPGNLGGALHLTWEDDDVQVNSNGTYTLSTTVGGSGTLTLTGIPAGYICSPTCGSGSCSITGVDPAVNGGGNNFYVTPSRGAWFQLEGAGAYAGSTGGGVTIRSLVPTSQDFILPGALGSIGALMRASGSYDVESAGGELSTTGWNAVTRYKGKTLNYSYFAAREGVTLSQTNDWASDTIDEKVDDGRDFWYIKPATQAVVASPWTITGGDSLVVFVDGDLRIASNITVSSGSFLAFIVRGDITIDKSVTAVQGLYVADGVLTTESAEPTDDVQLNVQGSMVAWGGVSLSRDLGSANINTPAEKFGYRPDLIVNMPTKMKTYALEWSEVVPGTFGE